MDLFGDYVSNTLASVGNQRILRAPRGLCGTGIVFLRVFHAGRYNWKFAYSDVIDSTYGDGTDTRCNDVCGGWELKELKARVVKRAEFDFYYTHADIAVCPEDFVPVTFGGNKNVTVRGLTLSDEVCLTADSGDYICLYTVFSGQCVPYHHESTIASLRLGENGYYPSPELPEPLFSGVRRRVRARFGFIGDSITQGCGTTRNAYRQYASVAADMLGGEFAFYDMGIGYARGSDAATDGAWLARAKSCDIVSVCFGVNDMLQGHGADEVKADLEKIVTALKKAGVKVLLQTVPPFDYDKVNTEKWRNVNAFILGELSKKADRVFNNMPILCADGENMPRSAYGAHPNDEGHKIWGKALAEAMRTMI